MKHTLSTLALALGFAVAGASAYAQTSTAAGTGSTAASTQTAPGAGTAGPGANSPDATPSGTMGAAGATGSAVPGTSAPDASGTTPGATSPAATDNQPAARTGNGESALADEDQDFLENAIQGSHAEIVGSQLALEKTENNDVRAFAQMMIDDHQKMVQEAEALATKKGMEPPTGPSALQTTEITALKALTGGAFDAMYVNRIGVASHEATVEMFEQASREAQDPEVKAMAEKTLPKLREHLEHARALNEKQEKQ